MKKDRSTYVLLVIIILAGIYMRSLSLDSVSLSNDELSALNRTQYADLGTMLEEGITKVDYHPVGVQVFLYFWTKAFGTATWLLRLPFVLCGALSIWLIFLIGRIWGNDRTGLIAAALLAGLAFPILYSRLARPYAPALLFVLGSAYFWTRTITEHSEKPWKDLAGFVLCGVLTVWTHYYAAITIATLGIFGFLFVSKTRMLPYALSGVVMILIAALHWPITEAQLLNDGLGGSEGWLDPPQGDWLFEFFVQAFNGHTFFWVLVCCIVAGLWYLVENKARWRPFTLFAALFLSNYAFGHWYSTEISPILQHSGLLFPFALLLIGFAYLIGQIPIPTKSIIPLALLVGTLYTSVNMPDADPYGTKQFGRFKELSIAFDRWEQEHPNDISFAANVNNPYYLEHYFTADKTLLVDIVKKREDMFGFRQALENCSSQYFAFCWSTIQMPPEAYLLIRQYYPYLVEEHTYFNSEVKLYSKIKPIDFEPIDSWYFGSDWGLPSDSASGLRFLENEYSPNSRITAQELRELTKHNSPYVIFEVEMRAPPSSNPVLVFDWQRRGKTVAWNGSELNHFYPSAEWRTMIHVSEIPEDAWMEDELKIYLWNRGPGRLEIKSIKTRVQVEL